MVTFNQNQAAGNNGINFLETLTVEQFKELFDVRKIDIVRNPHTGKLFFTYTTKEGVRYGKVTTRGKGENGMLMRPMISKLKEIDPQTGENIWMLHEESSENTLQTL